MINDIVQFLVDFFEGFPKELVIFFVSMLPILELRGGLIAASLLGQEMWRAIGICMVGNFLPIPFVLLLITKIFDLLKKTRLLSFVEKLESKAMSKSENIQKYEFWGLVLFVGIPLPGTGAWTGSLIAALLGLRLKKSVPAILLGLCMAATIMCVITYGIPWLIG